MKTKKTTPNKKVKIILAVATVILCLVFGLRFANVKKGLISVTDVLSTENANLTDWYIYGTHLNITLNIPTKQNEIKKTSLVLLKSEEITKVRKGQMIPEGERLELILTEETDVFRTIKAGDKINNGIELENIDFGSVTAILETVYITDTKNGREKLSYTYYPISFDLDNQNETFEYYSLTNNNTNKLVNIGFDKLISDTAEYGCLKISCGECVLPEDVYDIVLEVGHGGDDPGAVGYLNGTLYKESDFNLTMALKIKELLTEAGYKTALTREDDTDTPSYGYYGRATLCNTLKAKYNFSVHNNSNAKTGYTGSEIYIAYEADIALAKKLADALNEKGCTYSTMPDNKVADGVYARLHNSTDVNIEAQLADEGGYEPYETLDRNTDYYFMIREIGGTTTKAYIDGRNPKYEQNPYILSNNTAEGIILEFGYLNTPENLNKLITDTYDYCEGFVNGFLSYIDEMRTADTK